jgi:surface antigen
MLMLLWGYMKSSTTTLALSKSHVLTRSVIVSAAILGLILAPVQSITSVYADKYDDQINAKQNEIDALQMQAAKLASEADSLSRQLAILQNQRDTIQKQIDESQAKYNKLQAEIRANEKKIADNKDALGEIIADMYVDDSISPLEMLASSKNIGDFVDKQENRATVRSNLTTTINDIKTLKAQLEEQKVAVQRELKNQQNQRDQLAAKEAEQAKLLADTKGQEDAYRSIASNKQSEISSLRAAQAEENRKAAAAAGVGSIPSGTPGGGGYPGAWANAPLDAFVDNWGLYTRECVSYVAWKVWSTGRFVPHFGGAGNANQWPGTAAAYGISSGYEPRAGAAAVWNVGYYGHVMYVESVNGDGTITVSDYNLEWDGLYRMYTRSAAGLTYVYF